VALLPDRGPLRAVGAEMRPDGGASLREALEADLRRALGLLEAAVPAGDVDTVAYVAQFLGSMGEASEEAIRLSDVGSGELGTVEAAMLGGASLIAYLRRRLGRASGCAGRPDPAERGLSFGPGRQVSGGDLPGPIARSPGGGRGGWDNRNVRDRAAADLVGAESRPPRGGRARPDPLGADRARNRFCLVR
jgi:hypothetical protein